MRWHPNMHPDELARLVDRELKRLPAPQAPATLLPRVMAAVRARAGEAAPRTWMAWPLAWRLGSAAAAAVLIAGLVWAWPVVQSQVFVQLAALAEGPLFRIVDAWRELGAVSTAAGVIWRTVVQPLGWVVLPLVLLMWVACATFGAALGRVALGGATQS